MLTAANTFGGGTIISAGTLQIGNGGTIGSIVGDVINDGTVVFNRSNAVTFTGSVSGAGNLNQVGSGTLTLTGSSTYTGTTVVSAGSLQVDGVLGNTAVSVQSGAVLAGQGTIGGSVTIQNGGHLAPGPGAQTLGVGSLLLNPASILDYRFSTPGVIGSGVNSLVNVASNLTLDGVLNVTNGGQFGSGSYRLINYTGALTNLTLDVGTLPAGFTIADVTVTTAVAGQVNLVVNAAGAPTQFWDGSNTVSDGTVHGGIGTWINFVTTNFTNAAATANQTWQNGFAIFTAAPGTVTLGSDIVFQGMQFSSDGYTVVGAGAFALQPTGLAKIITDTGVTAIIAAPIAGAGGLNKGGAGLLTLTGENTYSGGTIISDGTLRVAGDANLGAASGGLTLDGGELVAGNAFSTSRPVAITANGGTLAATGTNEASFSGNLSGNGSLTIGDPVNTGIISLGGNNTYLGSTTIVSETTLQALSKSALSPASAFVVTGTLDLNGFSNQIGSLAGSGTVTNGGSIGAVLTAGDDNTSAIFGGVLQDGKASLGLVKIGTGILTLAGTDTYSGATTISTGTLQAGSTTAFSPASAFTVNSFLDLDGFSDSVGSLEGSGTVTNSGGTSATLTAGGDGSDTSFSGTLTNGSGGLGLTKTGVGTLKLTGVSAYIGSTTVSAGTLQAGSVTALSASSAFTVNSVLDLDGFSNSVGSLAGSGTVTNSSGTPATLTAGGDGSNTTFSGTLTNGPGGLGLTKTGIGTLILSGSNTYSEGTTISAGTLQAGSVTALSASSAFTVNSVLDLDGFSNSVGSLEGSGTVTNSGGTPATLTAGGDGSSTTFSGTLTNGSGSLGLTKTGIGTLVLSGSSNTYSGETTVSAGTLRAGSLTAFSVNSAFTVNSVLDLDGFSNSVGSLEGSGTVTNSGGTPATLTAGDNSSTTFSGTLNNGAGTLGLVKAGLGTLTLTGINMYSGGTMVSAGTLQAGSATAFSVNSAFTVNSVLDLDGFSNSVGSLAGSGTVTNSGGNPATLTAGGNGSNTTFSGTLTNGTGSLGLTKTRVGTLTVTGISSYTGSTTVSAGTLQAGSVTALSASSAFTVNSVLDLDGFSNSVGSLAGGGTVTNSGGTPATLTAGDDGSSTTFSGTLTNGTGGLELTKTGTGTLTLSGISTYIGGTTVSAGTLQAGSVTALSASSAFTVNSVLDLNGFSNSVGSLAGGGTVTNSGGTPATLTAGDDGSSTTFSGTLTNGTGSLELRKPEQERWPLAASAPIPAVRRLALARFKQVRLRRSVRALPSR